MKNISERVETEIIQLAKEHGIQKVILFDSRARGDNWERSDIDPVSYTHLTLPTT